MSLSLLRSSEKWTQKNRPPIRLGLMAGLGSLSLVLHRQSTLTAHRLTVPPSGERAVIVIIAIQALAHSAENRISNAALNPKGKYCRPKTKCPASGAT